MVQINVAIDVLNHPKVKNMKIRQLFILLGFLLFYSCTTDTEKGSAEIWKQEIIETELNFAKMAKDENIHQAFLAFAAEDAVLMRNNTLVSGKKDINMFFENQPSISNDQSLTWEPDFVDVAASGDLAYTYGQFTFSYTDSSGAIIEHKGIFHTVWKRQADGNWRFVWD